MHSFLCFSKIGSLHDIDLYLGLLSLDNCDFDSKQLSLPVAISACRAAPMGANPLGHTFKPLTLYDISIYTIYFSHPMGQEILAPCSYDGTMNHELFEDWFENHLLQELPKDTVIVMDNASFHRKEPLYSLAQKYDCCLIFLPPYSPELNPIEHFWSWLKRILCKILPKLSSLDEALFAAFYFRKQLALI